MAFKEVFATLQDLFSQVDPRMLRAVAIEHANDMDAAVESVLVDILPFINKYPETSYTLEDVRQIEDSSVGRSKPDLFSDHYEALEGRTIIQSGAKPVAFKNVSNDRLNNSAIVMSPHFQKDFAEFDHLLNAGVLSESTLLENLIGQEAVQRHTGMAENGNDVRCVSAVVQHEVDSREAVSLAFNNNVDKIPSGLSGKNIGIPEPRNIFNENTKNDLGDSSGQAGHCSLEPSNIQDLAEVETTNTTSASVTPPLDSFFIESSDFFDYEAEMEKKAFSCEHEASSKCSDESYADLSAVDAEILSFNDNAPATITTQSGHFVSTEFLEDIITNAKSSKKNLLSSMEAAVSLIMKVNLLEERVKQAKDEASNAGQDIFSKVDELKQILKRAKEANNMLAGEVYGEKSILGTESRELQSRLLFLSDERDKSLSVIEEIRQTLESRLAAAEEEIALAEQEKLDREALARKALSEQELIMDAIVEESKILQQEAEKNSKLREFLMERGHVVDTLQGEIAVICEDIMLLKERVEGRLPLKTSQHSVPSSLSSSLSSSYRSKPLSNVVPQHNSSKDSLVSEQDLHLVQHSKSNSSGEISIGSQKQGEVEDDWDPFEDYEDYYRVPAVAFS